MSSGGSLRAELRPYDSETEAGDKDYCNLRPTEAGDTKIIL